MRKQPKVLYRFKEAVPELLSSAIVRCIAEDDWVLKSHAISAVRMVDLDYNLAKTISWELYNDYWPVRLIAVFVLSQKGSGNIAEVLEYTTKHDENQMVKNMATLLLSKMN